MFQTGNGKPGAMDVRLLRIAIELTHLAFSADILRTDNPQLPLINVLVLPLSVPLGLLVFLIGFHYTTMHLILTGATGLVGSAVLHHMINTPSVTAVSILSRRPVPQADGHGKVKVIIHEDFNTYPSDVLERLQGAEGCVWAQGISITKVTKEFVYSLL
jgi:hypothetical protein